MGDVVNLRRARKRARPARQGRRRASEARGLRVQQIRARVDRRAGAAGKRQARGASARAGRSGRSGVSEAEGPQDASSRRVVKHSVVIAGHRTSVSLEDAFWRALKDIAAQDGVSLAALIARVDAGRGEANLSSAAAGVRSGAGIGAFLKPSHRPDEAVTNVSTAAWVMKRESRVRKTRTSSGALSAREGTFAGTIELHRSGR